MKSVLFGVAVLLAAIGAEAAELRTINGSSFYPEGPLWFNGRLHYVEYSAHRVMTWDGVANRPLWSQNGCGPAALIPIDGDLLVSCYDANTLVRISADGRTLNTIAADSDGQPFHGPNDFARDLRGGIYFSASGLLDPAAPIRGRIYYIAPDGSVRPVAYLMHYVSGLALANGGKTLLASEHLAGRILKFDVKSNGSISNRKLFKRLRDIAPEPPDADIYIGPNGLRVDSQGNIYICQYGAGRILVTDANGTLIRTIDVPDRYVTNLTFGETEDTLYIAGATDVWNPPYPGRVYELTNR